MGKMDDEWAQRRLERHRTIAGVTKSRRSQLVEQVTWVGLNGQWTGVRKARRAFPFFLNKDGSGTFDEGRILQAEELTANRWKAGIRNEAQTPRGLVKDKLKGRGANPNGESLAAGCTV